MSLQRINPEVLAQIHTTNGRVTYLINILQKRPLDRLEATELRDCETKMKAFATRAQVEFAAFRQQLERMRTQAGMR